jgi:hypothetical protein
VYERFNRLAWGLTPSESLSLPVSYDMGELQSTTSMLIPFYVCRWASLLAVCQMDPSVSGTRQRLPKTQPRQGRTRSSPSSRSTPGRYALNACVLSPSFMLTRVCAQVKGLQFNAFSPNLLASGAGDGDLCIWDLSNPSVPSLYPALKVNHPPPARAPQPQSRRTTAPAGRRTIRPWPTGGGDHVPGVEPPRAAHPCIHHLHRLHGGVGPEEAAPSPELQGSHQVGAPPSPATNPPLAPPLPALCFVASVAPHA